MTARSWPMYPEGDDRGDGRRRAGARGHAPRRARGRSSSTDGQVADGRTFSVPLAQLLYLPIFVAALRSFDPVGRGAGRAQIGRLVVRRANWSAPADELPGDLAAWARERGLPRRVFARSPLERKPRYVDFESPSLCRGAEAVRARGRRSSSTEMLPGPDECWLESDAGHHTSELRVVALGRSHA